MKNLRKSNLSIDIMELLWITEAHYLDNYRMRLLFNNGCWHTFDFGSLFGTNKLYDKIRSLSVFRQFAFNGWTVSWLDGTVDVSPEFLYENGEA